MKSKKEEVRKAIIQTLMEKTTWGYNELTLAPRIKKYGTETFNRYLKELVLEGTVHREEKKNGRTFISLDPDIKNSIIFLLEKHEEATQILEPAVDGVVSYLDLHKQDPEKYKISSETSDKLLNTLTKVVIKWYESYFAVIFMSTAGSIPTAFAKDAIRTYELQSKKIEKLLKKVKETDPIRYGLFLNYASGRFRLDI